MPIINLRSLFAIVAIASSFVSAQSAFAGSNCATHAKVQSVLLERFGETRRAMGMNENQQIAEIYASSRTGSWTVVITVPNGPSCVATSGQNYSDQIDLPQLIASTN